MVAQSSPQDGRQNSAEAVRPRLTPVEVASNANSKVSRLERCIAQLSQDDGAELRFLQVSLAKARAQSVLRPEQSDGWRKLRKRPKLFRRSYGAYRSAMRVALTEHQRAGEDATRRTRAWKLFLLIPRLLLFRPAHGGLLPKGQLQEQFNRFIQGQWIHLLTESRQSNERALQHQNRRQRTQSDSLERRAERAQALVHLGELSSGRQASKGAALAPGNQVMRRALTDATRRLPIPRAPLSEDFLIHQPVVPFVLNDRALEEFEMRPPGGNGRPFKHDCRAGEASS